MNAKVSSSGSVQERLRRIEHSINFEEWIGPVSAVGDEEGTAGGGGTHTHVSHEVPSGSGTSFALSATPVSATEEIFVNGAALRRVAAGAQVGEYSISGANLTIGWSLTGSDRIWAHYQTAVASTHAHTEHAVPSGSGTTWTLPATPTTGTEQVFVNGLEMRRVASGPGVNEYSISGAVVTLGFSLGGTDRIWAHYRT